ncbi:MAG: FeoA family protein [Candidatus Helarchaeota archaeon]
MKRVSLSDVKINQIGRVVSIEGEDDYRKRLIDMGITRGARIKMIRNAPLGDPIEFELRGYKLSLRKKEAKGIFIEIE